VFDHGEGFHPGEQVWRPAGGCGLTIVDALSIDWGVELRGEATEVPGLIPEKPRGIEVSTADVPGSENPAAEGSGPC
jgi:hypothetical protein